MSICINTVKTGNRAYFRDEFRRKSEHGRNGSRHGDGMNSEQALVWNMRTCRPDAKGETDVAMPHRKSTDAGHRGGSARSSDEISVMEMERRG